MRTAFLSILLLGFQLQGVSAFAVGNSVCNGGTGISRDGRVLTYGQAGVGLAVQPLNEVPGASRLDQALSQLVLNPAYQNILRTAAYPSLDRAFFKITEDGLTPQKRAQLLKTYQAEIGAPLDDSSFVVLALTDPVKKETFLLPEFFQLSDANAQAAILFHETLWVLSRQYGSELSYRDVIAAETEFESFLDAGGRGYDTPVYDSIARAFGQPWLSIQAAALFDKGDGSFGKFMQDGVIQVPLLFGVLCSGKDLTYYAKSAAELSAAVSASLLDLMQSIPKSRTFPALYRFKGQWQLKLTWENSGTGAEDTAEELCNQSVDLTQPPYRVISDLGQTLLELSFAGINK